MTVTKDTARRVLGLLDMFETPANAARETRIGLAAIRPYSDRASERVLDVLTRLALASDTGRHIARLREIASAS